MKASEDVGVGKLENLEKFDYITLENILGITLDVIRIMFNSGCSLICAMSCVSSGRMLSLFCSMKSFRWVKISSFHLSVRNSPSAFSIPICCISSVMASPTPVLSIRIFWRWKVWCALGGTIYATFS